MLRQFPLFSYEEGGDPLDYRLQAALGENLFSHQDARNLLRHGGMRPDCNWPQYDCALSYPYSGFPDTVRVEAGHITMPDLPSIGFEGKADLIRVMCVLAE